MKKLIISLILCLALPSLVHAKTNSFGVFISALKPSPGGLGLEIAYEYNEDIRITAGFGSVLWWTTVGIGAQYHLSKNGFSPYIGAQITHTDFVEIKNEDGSTFIDFDDIEDDKGGISASLDAGIDWQTGPGFTIGVGASLLINSFLDNSVLPHAYIGWMF